MKAKTRRTRPEIGGGKKAKRHEQIKNKFISSHKRFLKQTFYVFKMFKTLLNFMQIKVFVEWKMHSRLQFHLYPASSNAFAEFLN